MSVTFKKLIFISSCWFLLTACYELKPEQKQHGAYAQVGHLFDQNRVPKNVLLDKDALIDGQSESKKWEPDSLEWIKEFSFLKEINPNQPEYSGAFLSDSTDGKYTIELKGEENHNLKKIVFSNFDIGNAKMYALVVEKKEIFTFRKEINVSFKNGFIESYKVFGYQAVRLKDTVKFEINGRLNYE